MTCLHSKKWAIGWYMRLFERRIKYNNNKKRKNIFLLRRISNCLFLHKYNFNSILYKCILFIIKLTVYIIPYPILFSPLKCVVNIENLDIKCWFTATIKPEKLETSFKYSFSQNSVIQEVEFNLMYTDLCRTNSILFSFYEWRIWIYRTFSFFEHILFEWTTPMNEENDCKLHNAHVCHLPSNEYRKIISMF